MASPNLQFLLILLTISAVDFTHASHHAPSPSPTEAVDCSSLVLNMADCLSFVSNGSSVMKPEGTCCSGLKTVLKADAECLCEALKSSAQLGVVLNVTKAMTLPAACKLSAPSATNCKLSTTVSPAAAPAQSPISIAAAPSENEVAPAPAPASSGLSVVWISVGNMVMGLIVAAYFYSF